MALYPLTALTTLAALAMYFVAGLLVARARREHGVKAPATTGPAGFERAFRAQQNVLEWMPLFLPSLWLFALTSSDKWAAIVGAVWVVARLGYVLAYGAAAEKRGPYFVVQLLAVLVLWAGALLGVVRLLG